MSKMKARLGKGKRTKLAAILMLSVMLIGVIGGVTAFADWNNGTFEITVATPDKDNSRHGFISASLDQSINLQSDGVFVGTRQMNKVYILEVYSTDISQSGTSITLTAAKDSKWKYKDTSSWITGGTKSYVFNNGRSPITKGTFDALMSQLTLNFDSSNGEKDGKGKIAIVAYSSQWGTMRRETCINPNNAYTCDISFYDYATATADEESKTVDYKSDAAADYNSTYEDYAPENTENNISIEPADATGGKAEFDIYMSDMGGGIKFSVGYQYKKDTEVWTTANTHIVIENEEIEEWNKEKPIKVTVTGLEDGEDYDIRGVIITDGKTNKPTYTQELTFKYQKPNISSFNIGGVTSVYKGGSNESMELSMLATFNDENAIGKDYEVTLKSENSSSKDEPIESVSETDESEGNGAPEENEPEEPDEGSKDDTEESGRKIALSGPALKADIYFTPNRNFTVTKDADGNETYDKDNSKWYMIPALSNKIVELTQKDGSIASSMTVDDWKCSIPSSLSSLGIKVAGDTTGEIANAAINSSTCAFKLVVTDLYTGYSTVNYSDCFTIDSEKPTKPTVIAKIKGVDTNAAQLGPGHAVVTGGTGENGAAEVPIIVSGSTDIGGSGVKQYSYSMYYLPTDKAVGNTTAEVLSTMRSYSETNYGKADYISWAPLTDKVDPEDEDNKQSELVVSKDGYYRIIVRAEDNAGFVSDTVELYFRVDLTPPTTPSVVMVKNTGTAGNNKFEPYDNRTYTDSQVWAFAYSKPQTGKAISDFKFSTDGGLTWRKVSEISAENKIVALTNTTQTVSAYAKDSYTTTQNFTYQVGINLSGLGENDYVLVLVKTIDELNNESNVSDAAVMRTIADAPKPTSVLEHEGIEVALALGNTSMETSTLTADLKNAAAKKINAKYYGTTGSWTDFTASDFNPYLYILNYTDPGGSYPTNNVKESGHNCNWEDDPSCTGACHGTEISGGKYVPASCPYAILQEHGYEMFLPEMVNVQGISAADAASSSFKWTRFDHSQYNWIAGKTDNNGHVATVSYIKNTPSVAGPYTNLQGNTSYPTYTYDGQIRYTASQDRVIYTGQTTTVSSTHVGPPDEDNTPNKTSVISDNFASDNVHMWSPAGTFPNGYLDFTDTWTRAGRWWKSGNTYVADDGKTYPAANGWGGEGVVAKRVYHLVDMTNPVTAGKTEDGADLSKESSMTTLVGYSGYFRGCMRDWLYLNNEQPTKKTIAFSINDKNVFAHACDGYGFLFNTTIRQAKAGNWVLSGYMFYDGASQKHSQESALFRTPTIDFKWWIWRLDQVDAELFSDGYLSDNGDLALAMSNKDVYSYAGGTVSTIAYSHHDSYMPCIRNYRIVTEGNTTRIYMYNSGEDYTKNDLTNDELDAIYRKSDLALATAVNGTANSVNSPFSQGFKLINWMDGATNTKYIGGELNTPRPVVDGEMIGEGVAQSYTDANGTQHWRSTSTKPTYHRDTNCYGFGPLTGSRATYHGCWSDSRVVISHVQLRVNVARKLAEVVNEPQWGTGKAKFIANITNDSTEDFSDPVLTSQVQWRLFTDSARFIGWGGVENKQPTLDFISRIEGDGTYETNDINEYTDSKDVKKQKSQNQVDNVATYITKQYYQAFGFDSDSSTSIKDQVNSKIGGAGTVYSLDDINNINFSVTPEKYNSTSANPDYPSGRWYIVHDIAGYSGAQVSARNGTYSDALEMNVTEPGRYTIYFAPDASKIANGTLSSDDPTCVFDFVVNSTPVALFSGSIEEKTDSSGKKYSQISISDISYDPDVGNGPLTNGQTNPNGKDLTYTYTDAKGKKHTAQYNDVALNGIAKSEWRWEILEQDSEGNMYTVAADGWSENNPSKSLEALTTGKVTTDGKRLHSNAACFKNINELKTGAVMTVYHRVTDIATHKVAKYTTDSKGNKTFAGYEYETVSGKTSLVNQQNLTSKSEVTYAPLSAFSMSSPIIYDTAIEGSDNSYITITRKSRQTQHKTDYKVSWAIDLGDGEGYRQLIETQGGSYLLNANDGVPALECTEPPTVAANGEASGTWLISKAFLSKYVTKGKSLTLQITETIQGITQDDVMNNVSNEHAITDSSARAIYYSEDKKAPSAQTVTAKTVTLNGKSETESDYEASNYLDVSNSDKLIRITVGGSVDNEGKVAGYAYYFYEKNANGVENAWYKKNADGSLTKVSSAAAAYNILSADGDDTTRRIEINRNTLRKEKEPNDSLNVAIFAFDNQGADSNGNVTDLSKANKTARTRIENIKLSISKPVAPAISATNTLNENVASISNKYGYDSGTKDGNSAIIWSNASGVTGIDKQNSDLSYFSATDVTVKFEPKKAKFKTENGVLVETTEGGSEYYQDCYKKADMTGVATVRYTVKYKPYAASAWLTAEQLSSLGISLPTAPTKNAEENLKVSTSGENAEISATETLTFTNEGVYEVSAVIVNGSKIVSDYRTIEFTIDKTPPANLKVALETEDENGEMVGYKTNTWTNKVEITASDATDTNSATAKYQYSIDGGKTWIDMAYLSQKSITVDFAKSGKYTVMVRAVDKAGNASLFNFGSADNSVNSIVVCIDNTPPEANGPKLTANSVMTDLLTSYVLSLDYNSDYGKVVTVQENGNETYDGVNTLDREVAVPAGGKVRVEFNPEEGYVLEQILYKGEDITETIKLTSNGVQYVDIVNVKADADVVIKFAESDLTPEVHYNMSRAINMARIAGTRTLAVELGESDADNDVSTDIPDIPTDGDGETKTSLMSLTVGENGEVEIYDSNDEKITANEDGQYSVLQGTTIKFKATPNEGYGVASLLINETSIEGFVPNKLEYAYTIPEEESEGENEIVVSVTFGELPEDIKTFDINVYSSDGNAEITVSPEQVQVGKPAVVTIEPHAGYHIATLLVNGNAVDLDELKRIEGTNQYTYTFIPTEDTSVFVTADKTPTSTLIVTASDCGTFKIKNSIGDVLGSADGKYTVAQGEKITIEATPSDGYGVTKLTINGETPADFVATEGKLSYEYTVPTASDESDDKEITAEITFDVIGAKRTFNVFVGNSSDGNKHGNIEMSGETVYVPINGMREFVITPESGYRLAALNLYYTLDGEEIREDVSEKDELVQLPGDIRQYRYTLTDPGSNGKLEAIFERQTYSARIISSVGGDITIRNAGEGSMNLNAIPEGYNIKIEPIAKTGYRVTSLTIYEMDGVNIKRTYSLGAIKSYIYQSIHSDIRVEATYEKREVAGVETTHSITAVANNVKDADDALANEPYRFCIADGPLDKNGERKSNTTAASEWTAWSSSNTVTYTGSFVNKYATEKEKAEGKDQITISPNKKYYVYLMAKDKVGNITDAKESFVYSRANMPGMEGAEALNDTNSSSTKSVALTVDTSGNPSGTEYLVYVSTSSSMADAFIANESTNGGWAKLGAGNKFTVKGLSPGRWYYMQIVARNADGYSTSVSKDITSIMLSPAAPPEDTFYFEDQDTPNSPVKLIWEAPSGEVSHIQIYRDGMFIAELDANTLSYEDPRTNLQADAISQYSYAYVNSAGVGSSRVAISGEYYLAKKGIMVDDKYTVEPNSDKAAAMEKLVSDSKYEYLLSETMTYPSYHYGCVEPVSASANDDENSGTITVQMKFNSADNGRYQKYFLYLKAYKPIIDTETGKPKLDDEGNQMYESDPIAITEWDKTGVNRNNDGTQKLKETKVTTVLGETAARAKWTGLNTAYEYKIFVEKIQSNGKTTADNAGGQSSAGVEYTLGKQYFVTKEGYGYTYTEQAAIDANLNTKELTQWTEEELTLYTNGSADGWDTPVNKGYISFNKSPSVDLADDENLYNGNGDKVKVDSATNKKYLLIDNTSTDKSFIVNVAAWDPDGSREDSLIKSAVGGTISRIVGAAPEITEPMQTVKELATKPENLYPITFDASGLATGIYTDMELWASDSDTKTTKTTTDLGRNIRLVVNKNTPVASVVGGTSRQIQINTEYDFSTLVEMDANVAKNTAASENMTRVALMIMSEEYENIFGTSDYNTLHSWLVAGSGDSNAAAALAKAKELMGENFVADRDYVSTNGQLTEKGMNLAVVKVSPPITKYITVNETTYDNVPADKRLKDVGSGQTTYWAELTYALDNNLCSWLEWTDAAHTKVKSEVNLGKTDNENTYMMKLVASFGGNTSAQTVDFVVKDKPYANILSQKAFVWKDVSHAEYKHYSDKGITVGQVRNNNALSYSEDTVIYETPKADPNDLAYKTAGDIYYVYKLTDTQGNVGNDYITGKINANLGIHSQFNEVGVLLITENAEFDPNGKSESEYPQGSVSTPVYANYNNNPVTVGGDLQFGISNLNSSTTYYLWSYYRLPEGERVYSKSYVAITTDDQFATAQYGFTTDKSSYKEKDYTTAKSLPFSIEKMGSNEASATVRITPEYYESDEFGTILYNSDGTPKQITGEKLALARETFGFASGNLSETITFGNETAKKIYLQLKDTDGEQGHMVVRLKLSIDKNDSGYCYIANGAEYTDVFVQDDESPVTSFIMGLVNKDEDGEPYLKEVKNGDEIDYYSYEYSGLQVDYNLIGSMTLYYENLGTGDLENITVGVYDDREGNNESAYFEAGRPSEKNLKKALGTIGNVEIQPIAGLEDGVYDGWVLISADHMEEPIKIKIRQVVGQSTLKGRIYITPEMPSLNARTGVAKVSLYDATKTAFVDGKFTTEPVYTTYTSEYGGEFEIRNILNKGSYSKGGYYIVVERDGFLTYNGVRYATGPLDYSLQLTEKSATYTFNLRLIGGDVNGDDNIDDSDLEILVDNYNKYPTEDSDEAEKLCDFNQDGVINALDRGFMIGNMGWNSAMYSYYKYTKIEPDAEIAPVG